MNYDYEFEDFNDIESFTSRLQLSQMFSTLPSSFSYPEFYKAFTKTYGHLELEKSDVLQAFLSSIDFELIDEDETNPMSFVFNGVAFITEKKN